MRSGDQIPIQSTTRTRAMKRHHTARYYAHRVKESLTARITKLICSIFLFILFVLGLIAFILWLSLRPHRPRFHIHEFSIPSFSQEIGYANANIIFNVTDRNPNHKVGFYFDAMQITVNYQVLCEFYLKMLALLTRILQLLKNIDCCPYVQGS